MVNIYLEIEGVLLTKNQKIPRGVIRFIKQTTDNNHVFLFSKDDDKTVKKYLKSIFPKRVHGSIDRWVVINYLSAKMLEIDLDKDFLWFSRIPLYKPEYAVFEARGVLESYILVDLDNEPNFYTELMDLPVFTWGKFIIFVVLCFYVWVMHGLGFEWVSAMLLSVTLIISIDWIYRITKWEFFK